MKLPLRREVEDAFAAALEMSQADQEAFLARDYAQDPELRAEVSSMLREWEAACQHRFKTNAPTPVL